MNQTHDEWMPKIDNEKNEVDMGKASRRIYPS